MTKNQSNGFEPEDSRKGQRSQYVATGHPAGPVARWQRVDDSDRLVLENAAVQVEIWPAKGGAITRYVDRASELDVIWRNPYGHPSRLHPLDQPVAGGSDLYDVMDGSWYVSLPNGFYAGSYLGAPLGTHGELRSLPWEVVELQHTETEARVTLRGQSVRTPLCYHRTLTLKKDDARLFWREGVENRAAFSLPVAWLQHPTLGGPLLEGARLLVPARTVRVAMADDPTSLQLESGYEGAWPWVPERTGGGRRDCSVVSPADSGLDHSVQLTDLREGWGCVWNEERNLGFAMEWDLDLFPYAWSWNSAGGIAQYPLWGEGHIITLQPSTSPVGRFEDLVATGEVMTLPPGETISTDMTTGFFTRETEPRITLYSSE